MLLTEVRDDIPFRDDLLGCQAVLDREAVSSRTLPASLGCPSTSYLKQRTAGLRVVLACEISNDGSNEFRLLRTSVNLFR